MKKTLVFVVIIVVCLVLIFGLDSYQWNNGICRECHNGSYTFVNGSNNHRGLDHYYYECDNCGHVIMIHMVMD